MKYSEAKPFLKEGMGIKLTYCKTHESESCMHCGKRTIQLSSDGRFLDNENCFFTDNDELEILINPDGSPWIHPDKQKFKVGDRVRGLPSASDNYFITKEGWEGIVEEIDNDTLTISGYFVESKHFEKIKDAPDKAADLIAQPEFYKKLFGMNVEVVTGTPVFSHSFSPIINQPKKTFMNSIISKIKDLKLTSEDRLLRKHGLEDESGKMTDEADELMDQELREERWAKRRLEIAADLKKVEEQEA